ncbi:anaerobic ribonucleoside-triphosphate reductase-activating protein [Paraferrimonas sedimenticola]|uniref:Anaerobic ribonucleoside-triphosphate reductase-activating protein n=1 Tax=Paraferrimonas sedimenticola TaxID=375674 RepID=A0AA37W0C5_9GAMM|nr:anaerobic ribonucleoside-triphosphate reductase-activating protein [Paraferrimonas sedimenticola]GLP97809.1 anaerobic ribonucleoside-triphosphate reductase-activating protein [Paraferrimonas sedimenticola]
MNYSQYYPVDVINGPGTRATLFVSGCEHQCRGCYNQSTWSPDSGEAFSDAMVEQIIVDLNDTRIRRRGLSLTGGDPLYPGNLDAVLNLLRHVKARAPGKDVWMWTGYTLENLSPKQRQVVELVDTLVDGKFEQDKHDPNLRFRGSSNQRLIPISQLD